MQFTTRYFLAKLAAFIYMVSIMLNRVATVCILILHMWYLKVHIFESNSFHDDPYY